MGVNSDKWPEWNLLIPSPLRGRVRVGVKV